MKYLKTYEAMSSLSWSKLCQMSGDSYLKQQERLRVLEDMSLELWDENFNVQVSSEILSRAAGIEWWYNYDIIVNIVKRGSKNRFDYSEIKDTFLSMVSYMESEGYSISIDVSDKYLSNLPWGDGYEGTPVELKGDELYLKYKPEQMIDYPIEQLMIFFTKL